MNNLENVKLGNNVTKIGKDAFCGCARLTEIKIPDSVKYIDDYAFIGCSFNKVLIGKNVEYIGDEAFGYFDYILSNKGTAFV